MNRFGRKNKRSQKGGSGQPLDKSLGVPLATGYFGNGNEVMDEEGWPPSSQNWDTIGGPEGEVGWGGMSGAHPDYYGLYASQVCPSGWTGTYPNCTAPWEYPVYCDDPFAQNYGQPGPCNYDWQDPGQDYECPDGGPVNENGQCGPIVEQPWCPDGQYYTDECGCIPEGATCEY